MQKRSIVRLSDAKRASLEEVAKRLAGSSQKVKLAKRAFVSTDRFPKESELRERESGDELPHSKYSRDLFVAVMPRWGVF